MHESLCGVALLRDTFNMVLTCDKHMRVWINLDRRSIILRRKGDPASRKRRKEHGLPA